LCDSVGGSVSATVFALVTAKGRSEVTVALTVVMVVVLPLVRIETALQRRPPQHRTIQLRKGLLPPESAGKTSHLRLFCNMAMEYLIYLL
jgi:hypothetical protein